MGIDIVALLAKLASERPIFHDEADFKRALTALIRRTASGALVSNERKAFANETKRLDILVEQQGTSVAIELKYPVRRLEVEIQGDYYALKDQAAQDLTRYDFVKDIRRLERAVEASPQMVGYAILLTNDSAYWKPPSRSDTADACFRLHEGAGLGGTRQWASSASPGTTKDREQALNLEGAYHLSWRDYSTLPVQQSYNRFRYLLVPVSRNDATAPHQSS